MMTSGQTVKYTGSLDAARQILREGPVAMFRGAGANVVRAVASAGVLAGYDKFKEVYVQWRIGK